MSTIQSRRAKARKRLAQLKGVSLDTKRGGGTLAMRSQGEVAALLGISAARVSQLERSGLAKLRKALAGLGGGS